MTFKLPLLCLTICLLNCTNPSTSLYVGTYTDEDSEGIYQFEFNSETGELNKKQLATTSENPSFISYSPDKNHIYAVNENENGTISAFKVEDDKTLTLINKVSTQGAHPCHVTINKQGDKAVVSNYTGGNFSLHTVENNGILNEAFQVINHKTDSLISHVHSAQFFNEDLYVADLGLNAVFNYQLSNNNYKLVSPSIVKMENNAGPRHFSLTKDGKFIYIINELSSTITSAKKTKNGFEFIETVSTLADAFKEKSYCADIHLSKDEQFLYGSNRGENSIVVFKRDITSGKLNKIQNIRVHGDWPRNFTLDPTGRFLLVANQKSHNISVFKIDGATGKLNFLHSVEIPSPVCLLF
ncbi:lactonase family protein [Flavivirga sp. 57AJ16]|uniref:lactonase family protein n=1 Tax=Flavivirga sp. 57AJ16 TaxID=3025307 RepID=UPI0023662E98|nr:lactonase family protein [Flavivirga sp. 57AJ16]MDD7884518.1 lactonase family protein [Flavivirga sp. 57AJ16]